MKKSAIILLFFFAVQSGIQAQNWEKWRGPQANGAVSSGLPERFTLSNEHIMWTQQVGYGHAAAAVQGNRLYTSGNMKKDGEEQDIIWCLDINTGQPVWQHSYPAPNGGEDPGPGSTPVLDGNRLYTLSRWGHLFCFNAEDGSIIWKRHLVDEKLSKAHSWGFASSCVIHENILLINVNQNGLALDKNTGSLIWNSPEAKCGFSTPVLMNTDRGWQMILNTNRKMRGVNPQTGQVLWTETTGWGDADPIPLGDRLLFAGQSLILYRIEDGRPVRLWKNKDLSWQFQSGAVYEDHYYGFGACDWDNDKQVFNCIDLTDGKIKWQEIFEMWGASTVAGDKVIIQTGLGETIIAPATPEGFKPITRAKLLPMADNSQFPERRACFCWTYPVLSSGRLYLRNTHGSLICLNP